MLNKKLTVICTAIISLPIFASAIENASNTVAVSKLETQSQSCIPGKADTSASYMATKWYRNSAERNAQYNEIFRMGLEKVSSEIKQQHLKNATWGVILDIDETVLDNSEYEKENLLACSSFSPKAMYTFMEQKVSVATPGAHNLTCSIQKEGGKVVLVTNRDGTFDDTIQNATVENLKSAGICFNNVIFANGGKDNNKTPRFEAIIAGNYKNIIATNKLPKLKILAYFGDNIQDFPDITQTEAIKEDPNGDFYKKFGQIYFSLPNPTYGSWEKNQFN